MGDLQRREQHVGEWRHQVGRGVHWISVQLPTSEQLEIDGRDRRQRRFDLLGHFDVVADDFRQLGWDVQQPSLGAATDGQIDIRTVELALSTSASLLTTRRVNITRGGGYW